MKNLLLMIIAVLSLKIQAVETKLGFIDNPSGRRAVRVYLDKTENGLNVVLLEYTNLFEMAPKYIMSNKSPYLSKKFGYLNEILSKVHVFKALPLKVKNAYELQTMKISQNQIVVENKAEPSILILPDNSLNGASISKAPNGLTSRVYFPKDKEEGDFGLQYSTAKLVYEKAKLESTWRDNFLQGDYLGAYYDKDDVILKLKKESDGGHASFIKNEKRANLTYKEREDQLTNPKSAYIKGDFIVHKLEKGMFSFESAGGSQGAIHVEGRIAMFIDIFDATKSLNQDVVELILVNAQDPSDFLMYYEHPANGEGEGSR